MGLGILSITEKQPEEFNRMRDALREIRDDCESSRWLSKNLVSKYAITPEVAIEYASDNVK